MALILTLTLIMFSAAVLFRCLIFHSSCGRVSVCRYQRLYQIFYSLNIVSVLQSAVEQLESEVQQKQTDMETLQKKLEAVISSDREKELKIQELSAEAKKYRDMYDMLKVNFERLTTWHSNVETGNVKQQSEDRRVSEASVK